MFTSLRMMHHWTLATEFLITMSPEPKCKFCCPFVSHRRRPRGPKRPLLRRACLRHRSARDTPESRTLDCATWMCSFHTSAGPQPYQGQAASPHHHGVAFFRVCEHRSGQGRNTVCHTASWPTGFEMFDLQVPCGNRSLMDLPRASAKGIQL